jgi:ParB-like chromosome segregation protein Spo0J
MEVNMIKTEIKRVNIKDLKSFKGNPRKIDRNELEKLKNSILEFGYSSILSVTNKFEVLGGNQRKKAIEELLEAGEEIAGIDKEGNLEVLIIEGLTKEQQKALNIALNKISGDWDVDLLSKIINEINGTIDTTLTGFDSEEIDILLKEVSDNVEETNSILEEEVEFEEDKIEDDVDISEENQTYVLHLVFRDLQEANSFLEEHNIEKEFGKKRNITHEI